MIDRVIGVSWSIGMGHPSLASVINERIAAQRALGYECVDVQKVTVSEWLLLFTKVKDAQVYRGPSRPSEHDPEVTIASVVAKHPGTWPLLESLVGNIIPAEGGRHEWTAPDGSKHFNYLQVFRDSKPERVCEWIEHSVRHGTRSLGVGYATMGSVDDVASGAPRGLVVLCDLKKLPGDGYLSGDEWVCEVSVQA